MSPIYFVDLQSCHDSVFFNFCFADVRVQIYLFFLLPPISLLCFVDMSEREKLKAVQQAMKKGAKSDIPSKVYVVAGKGPTGSKKKGAKVKMVDSRMKSDTRGAKRANTKQKTGKAPKKKKGKGRQGRH